GEACHRAWRALDLDELAALDAQPPGARRRRDAVAEPGRAREITLGAEGGAERRRELVGTGEVQKDLDGRRRQPFLLDQAHDPRRSGPPLVVRDPVAG